MNSHLIQDSIRDGSLVLYHDYRAGHALDLSGQGNHGTFQAGTVLRSNGMFVPKTGSGGACVVNSASINLTTATCVVLIQKPYAIIPPVADSRICAKRTGAGTQFDLRMGSQTLIIIEADNTTAFTLSNSVQGPACFGIELDNGNAAAKLYLDGVYEATISAAQAITAKSVDLYIGNLYTLDKGFGATESAFLMFNKLLTADEHRQAYLELLK